MKNNCFNFIKVIAAFLVIISHSFPISLGKGNVDFINNLTNGQIDLGNFSVCIFFIIGGYFITKSLENSKSIKEYLIKRVKKIFPALILAMFITTFIIAPFFYDGSYIAYFINKTPYIYFFKNSLLITTHTISGVFAGNIYNESINGALWTLSVEFLCYIAIIFAFTLKFLDRKNIKYSIALVIILTFMQTIIGKYIPIMSAILPLGLLFFEGAIYYIKRDEIKFDFKIFLLFIILIVISLFFDLYIYTKILLLPYIIYYIGFKLHKYLKFPKWLENISYEIYLYGFFIQQTVCYIFNGHMNPYINMILSIPVTIIIAYIANKILEMISKKVKLT